jgi:hypothetical protein
MTHSFPIAFEAPPKIDAVTLAVVAFDVLSGQPVTRGVEARVTGLSARPIRNRSGLLVFVNLPAQATYEVQVTAALAGYFDPEPLIFTPPAANDPNIGPKRRLPVALRPRPDFAFLEGTTLIRGMLVRGGAPAAGAMVWAEPLAGGASPFTTTANGQGEFALPLRLPVLAPDEPEAALDVVLHFKLGPDERVLTRPVRNGAIHRFAAPIDLSGGAAPDFLES